jgi:hypothetical protein
MKRTEKKTMKPTIPALLLILFAIAPAVGFQQKAQEPLTRYAPENCGLSLELPSQPEHSPTPTQVIQARPGVRYLNVFVSGTSNIVIFITHTAATSFQSPKSVADGIRKDIFNTPGVSDLAYSTEPATDMKAPIKGTYRQNNGIGEINGVALSQGNQSWLVVTLYVQSDKAAQALGQQVLDSIRMNGAPCPEK